MDIYYIGTCHFPEQSFKVVNLEEISQHIDWLNSKEILAFDIETTRKFSKGKYREDVYKPGLDPYVTNVIMAQIGNLERQYIIDTREISLEILRPILTNDKIIKIIHNAQFEHTHMLHNLKIRMRNVWDTMIVDKLLNNGRTFSYSLKEVAKRRLDVEEFKEKNLFSELDDYYNESPPSELDVLNLLNHDAEGTTSEKIIIDKGTRTQFIEWGSRPFTVKQIQYGANDLLLPYNIYLSQKDELKNGGFNPKEGIILENDTTFVLAEMSYRGMPLDILKWRETEAKNRKIYIERLQVLNKFIEDNYPQFAGSYDLFSEGTICFIDWASSKQVISLYRHWGICPKEKSKQTGKIEWTVGAKSLQKLLTKKNRNAFNKDIFPETITDINDFTLAYLLFKKTEQLLNTFGEPWLKHIHPITKRVHTHYNQLMISTRLSSNNPNIQNIPKNKDFRGSIDSKGMLICADYTAQEVYAACIVHDSYPLYKFFMEGDEVYGKDIHSFMAAKTFKIVYQDDKFFCKSDSEERQMQKVISFQSIYGGSEHTLAASLGISEQEALDIQNGFKIGFELNESFSNLIKESMRNGYIELDPITQKRYYYPYFNRMKEAFKEVMDIFPFDYKEWDKERREEWKSEQRATNPKYTALWREYGELKGKLERRTLNLKVQGLCASMTKKACVDFSNWLWENNLQDKCSLIISCHDELIAEVVPSELENVEFYGNKLREYMENASAYFLKGLVSEAEPLYSTYWSK